MTATETTSSVERSEEALSWVGLAAAETLRVAELAVIAVAALLFCPPLLILVVVVVVPIVVLAALVALIASVIALPVFVVRHFHRHRAGHAHHRVRGLAELGRTRAVTATSRAHRVAARALAKLGKHDHALDPSR